MNKRYLMVRAMTSQEIHFKEFFDNNIVAVGWSRVHFEEHDNYDNLRDAVRKEYYSDKSGRLISKKLNECIRFKKIKAGDRIIIPYYSGIALAIAEKEELYSEEAYNIDLSNQHRVSFLNKNGIIFSVPRNNLSEGLQRRLRVPGMCVSDLSEFSEEIDKLFENPETYSYSGEAKQKEDALRKEFMQELLNNIQGGKTNLQTGGIGMEHLIKELFECEGYCARVLAKTTFEGSADADIEAWRDDAFSSIRIYAQVKHHGGYSGRKGIDQVIKAIEQIRMEKGEEYKGIFITSARVSDDDKKYAEDNNIAVIDGERIVEIITSNLSQLSKTTITKLGVVMVPSIFNLTPVEKNK